MRTGADTIRDAADEFRPVDRQAGHTRAGVLAILSALAALGAYGAVKGFNGEPRTKDEGGIVLSDPELDRELQCVRDAFGDAAGGVSLTRNKWMTENCGSIEGQIDQALDQDAPLRALADLRDKILRKSGECKSGAEIWRKSYKGQGDGFRAKIQTYLSKCKPARFRVGVLNRNH